MRTGGARGLVSDWADFLVQKRDVFSVTLENWMAIAAVVVIAPPNLVAPANRPIPYSARRATGTVGGLHRRNVGARSRTRAASLKFLLLTTERRVF
jgi:hypothetical protein